MVNYEVTKENEEMILGSVPTHVEDLFSFRRKERNGYNSVRINTVPRLQELFLNQTTIDIMSMFDGERTCNEVLDMLVKTYPDVPKQTLKNDFMKVASLLSRFQMINWVERNPFMAEYNMTFGDYSFELLDDTDIRGMMDFLEKNEANLKWNNIMHEYKNYDELYIRDMLFNFTEDFFAIKSGNDILALASMKYSVNVKSSVAAIGVLVGEELYMNDLIRGMLEYYDRQPFGGRVTKIKVQMIDANSEEIRNEKMEKLLLQNGFVYENTCKKEYKGMDLKNYCYFIAEGENA